ncbi:MAG TPA: SPOR domain-containing protein [Acidobacteriaceae bacterium]
MNSILDDDDDERDRNERELTLSTGMILGIFLGLILLCGLFFGFGYKMGSHKPMPPVQAATAESSPTPATTFESFKPAAGSPAGAGSSSRPSMVAPEPSTESADRSNKADRSHEASRENSAPAPHNPQATTAASAPITGTGFNVQVAAVSHQEDAELLVNALRAKGYPVSAHTEPQDKFFHIQVGPYSSREDAESAKQRLVADGYQPIVK